MTASLKTLRKNMPVNGRSARHCHLTLTMKVVNLWREKENPDPVTKRSKCCKYVRKIPCRVLGWETCV